MISNGIIVEHIWVNMVIISNGIWGNGICDILRMFTVIIL
jgi:hypothetical protein